MRSQRSILKRTASAYEWFVLAAGFVALLVLIYIVGSIGTSRLEELRGAASDRSQDYSERLKHALKLRELAGRAVAEARLYSATQSLRARGPAFRSSLSEARTDLEAELKAGRKLIAERTTPLSGDYRDAFSDVQQSIDGLWQLYDDGEPLYDALYAQRQQIELSTDRLVNVVLGEGQKNLDALVNMQQDAENSIASARWRALIVGLAVAALTLSLIYRQLAQLKRANVRIQEAQDFARSVFDSQSNDVLVMSEDGEILAANLAFQNHSNLREYELRGRDLDRALSHLPQVAYFVRKAIQERGDDRSHRDRIEATTGNEGETRLLDVYISPLTLPGGGRGKVVTLVDVTEAERARDELRRNRTLSTIGQLTAQVAHEIYNPLGALKLNLEVLESKFEGNADAQPSLTRLKRSLDHLATIVMDLKYLTRPRAPERRSTDLNKIMDEVVDLAGDRLLAKQINVERKYSSDGVTGQFDQSQLRKVFLNLLINAIDASPEMGSVQIRTQPDSSHVAVSIVDHGEGMSAETRRHLFEPFYSTKQHGTGLGMMVAQEIVRKHNGRMEIESALGAGTTITVLLPTDQGPP
jgi:PAS domain S-box-containing protein